MSNKELNSVIDKAEDEYQKLKDKVVEQGLEIERLNNIINKKEQFLGDNIKRLEREVVKRDNIINELEKDFERKIQSCTIEAETTTNDFYCKLHIATLKKWLNRLKELKGSDKE